MKTNHIVSIAIALISALGGILAVRMTPSQPDVSSPVPPSSVQIGEGATVNDSDVISTSGETTIVINQRRNRGNRAARQAEGELAPRTHTDGEQESQPDLPAE